MTESTKSATKNVLKGTLCAAFAVCCLVFSDVTGSGIKKGLTMCYNSIIPSLLPFMFACTYIFSLLSHTKSRLLKTASCAVFALIGGFPMGAKGICALKDSGVLDKRRAECALSGAVNAGPAFLISGVGAGMFGSARAGVMLFISLSAASVICGALFLLYAGRSDPHEAQPAVVAEARRADFISALDTSVTSTVFLCGCVTFFCAVSELAKTLIDDKSIATLLALITEVSGGCRAAADTGGLEGLFLACLSVSLCSVSIVMQIKRIVADSGISLKYFYLSRPLHCVISAAVLKLLSSSDAALSAFSPLESSKELFSLNPEFSFFFLLTGIIFITGSKRFARPIR